MRRSRPLHSLLPLMCATLAACVDPFPDVQNALSSADMRVRDAFVMPPADMTPPPPDMQPPDMSVRPEACNGEDDDGDGAIDEEVPIRRCPLQDGVCANTRQPCLGAAGYGTCTYSEANPVFELDELLCDGADNDCDGDVDEGCDCMPGDSRVCGSDVGTCETGRQFCADTGQYGECGNAIAPVDEICDGLDNDCDGRVDDLDNTECETGEPGRCAKGRKTCVDGAERCVPIELPVEEACTGEDDDCDGRVDEDTAGGECDTTRAGICAVGRLICAQGRPRCTSINNAVDEVRGDGLDNDCDGVVDERTPPVIDLADIAVGGVGALPGQVAQRISLNGALEPGGFQASPNRGLDGAFSPSRLGLTPIDTRGTTFDFGPEVAEDGVGTPLAKGPTPAWVGPEELPDYDGVTHSIIELRVNTGLTFDISRIAADNDAVPRRLELRFGNLGAEGIIGMVLFDGVRRVSQPVPIGAEVNVDLALDPQLERISIVLLGGAAAAREARTYVGDATVRFDVAD